MSGANGHRPAQQASAATITIIDGGQLYTQVVDMAATLVRTETLLAAHLESEREAREQRRQEREDDDSRFAQLERRVWAVPGAGTLIALAGVVVAVLSLKGG
jgi:hypothetical protein